MRRLSAYTLWDRLARLWDRLAVTPPRATAKLALLTLEDRLVPDSRPLPYPTLFFGAGAGDSPVVKAYAADTGDFLFSRTVYDPDFTGGVRVASADITGDGFPDLIAAPGAGGGPRIKVLDGHTGEPIPGPLGSFWAFEPTFTGGVEVAAADVDGDGRADIIAAAGEGGSPRVRVFSGADGSVLADFYAYAPDFMGGVHVAAADFDGDGKAEVAVGAGVGGGPRVKVYDPLTGSVVPGPLGDFFAFDPAQRGGAYVGTTDLGGDVTGDGVPDLVVGTGPGTGSDVKVFDGTTGAAVREFSPFGPSMTAGVTVGAAYVDNDSKADIVAGTAAGVPTEVRVFSGADSTQLADPIGYYQPFGPTAGGGVWVASSNDPLDPHLIWTSTTPSAPVVGEAVQLAVNLTGSTVGGVDYIPGGVVTFYADNGTTTYTLGTAPVVTVDPVLLTAEAELVTRELPGGTYNFSAHFTPSGTDVKAFLSADVAAEDAVEVSTPTGPADSSLAGGCPPDPVAEPAGGGATDTGGISPSGVGYGSGNITLFQPGLTSGGFGSPLGAYMTLQNTYGINDGLTGAGATMTLPYLGQGNLNDAIVLISNGREARYFDRYAGSYHARYGSAATLTHNTSSGEFVVTDGAGDTFTFYDFSSGTPAGRAGRMISESDPAGNTTTVTSWASNGGPAEIQRTAGSGSTAVTESFVYTYVASGANAGLLASVTQRHKTGTGSWETTRSVAYTYYAGGTYEADDGGVGDLKYAVIKDGSGTPIDTYYYRWYTSGGSGGGSGTRDEVKYAFGPAAEAQLEGLATSLSLTHGVDDLTDAQAAPYADAYLEYDSSDRVVTAVTSGTGCSACSGGQGTFTYTYTANTSAGLRDPNTWFTKTVESLLDGTTTVYTNTVYTNASNQVLLVAHSDGTNTWDTYTRYDAAGRVVLTAAPSAVTGFSESYPDLVGYSGGSAAYLATSDGLMTACTYAAATTATSSTPGDAAGYLKEVDLLHGTDRYSHPAVPQASYAYIQRTAGGVDYFFPASSTVYRNDDGTGGQATDIAYTWQGSTAQPATVIVTLPTVTTAENGPNTATSTETVFDTYGRPIWEKDAGGFITYTAYDDLTGAVTGTIEDVDTSLPGTPSTLPSGWATPTGGGLNLVTSYQVDDLGRVTREDTPAGRVNLTVYNDAAHEVRYYPGWNDLSSVPTQPTVVTREDRAGRYTETLTMTAPRGYPLGSEPISQVQSLSRQYMNDAGQVVAEDDYFDLAGLTYSTSTSLGTSGVNYYRTEYGYDHGGLRNKTVSPEGTIYRTVYDGQGRAVSDWVGTNDTPTSGYWSPSNPAGMTEVRSYEYDGGGVGDGNLTQVTEYPGGGAANRVTQAYYDWRDRAVATKAGVEGSESSDVNRPIVYQVYDNLDEVTETQLYDGDGVSIGSTAGVPDAPSSGLLRAQTKTSYDELGQVYRQDVYDVDPSSGSVGSYTLHSDTWYDSRGLVIKQADPGGLVTKTAHDGVGRTTAVYTTDGYGDSSYADASDVSDDNVLEQAEYTYDGDGNVLTTTDRQRFHDETTAGPLGDPISSGLAHARVYYSGNYYDTWSGRLTDAVDVGTNGGSAWTPPGSVPSSGAAAHVTHYDYAADAVQDVRLTGSPAGGTFTLTFNSQTTGGIAYNASAATVQSAVEALTSVGSGNVVVTDAPGGGWEVRFAGTMAAQYQVQVTADGSGLTGGTSTGVAVSTISQGGNTGDVAAVTDPRGLVTRTYADALGRTVRTVEDFTDGQVTDSSDKTTGYTYNAAGQTSLTAYLTGGGGQTTAWVYGVTTADSGIDSNDVVGATKWPDKSTGAASSSEEDTVTVNALGETATATDRNGTTHTYTYDVLGRVVADAVTTLGSGVDGAVRRIETAYDGQGNPYLVTSYDAASGGSVVNQVERVYNGLGQLTAEYQEHGGAVNTSTTPVVQYAYSEMAGGANHSRPTSVTYPDGYTVAYNYASGVDDSTSRLSSLSDTTGTLEAYSYLGLGTVVIRSHPQATDLTYVGSTGAGGDQYSGLDAFGRVVDQLWTGGSGVTDRFQYGYDEDSNRTFRDNLVDSNFGEAYTYDGLNQVATFARGVLSGGTISSPTRTLGWAYDAVGNFNEVFDDTTGTEYRSANAQNEITYMVGPSSPATPTYDAAGNMTGDEAGRTFEYDAWNRLVAVKSGSTTLETMAYDGLGRRVATTDAGTSTTTDLYYSSDWQVLEEAVGGAATTRYVWSPVYVDAMVLRDRATTTPGTLDERLWVQQDANWNVTALVNGTGTVVERYVYDPYGAVTVYDGIYTIRSGGSAYGWVYTFQGLRHDAASGLDEARMRWYSPTLGRWMNTDPIRFEGGDVNMYRFVGNAPINALDPSGEVLFVDAGVAADFKQRFGAFVNVVPVRGGRFRIEVLPAGRRGWTFHDAVHAYFASLGLVGTDNQAALSSLFDGDVKEPHPGYSGKSDLFLYRSTIVIERQLTAGPHKIVSASSVGLGGRPMARLGDSLSDASKSQAAQEEAQRIATAIGRTYNNNRKPVLPSLSHEERNKGFFCWEWAYGFMDAFKLESSGRFFQASVEAAGTGGEEVHYWLKITSLETGISIYVDDGFMYSGNYVHDRRPDGGRYQYTQGFDSVKPRKDCTPPRAYPSKDDPYYFDGLMPLSTW
jgi:RHS repeat-associated protein